MRKYHLSADVVPEKEIIVNTEEEAIAWFAYFSALTNVRLGLDREDAYCDYHNRNKEDADICFADWVSGCDMVYCEIIEEED